MIPLNIPAVKEASDRCVAIASRFMESQTKLLREGPDMSRDERDDLMESSLMRLAEDLKTLDPQESALTIILLAKTLSFAWPIVSGNVEDAILLSKFGEEAKAQLESFKRN